MRESMVAAFLRAGPQMINFLEDNTSVAFRTFAHHPDYLATLEGATLSGRVLEPLPFNGAVLGKHLATLRRPLPEFTLLGGMMVDRIDIGHLLSATKSLASLRHVVGLVGRYGGDRLRFGRGARCGNALAGRLYHSVLHRDVPILMLTEARSLIEYERRITGVVLQTPEGLRDRAIECGAEIRRGSVTGARPLARPARLTAARP